MRQLLSWLFDVTGRLWTHSPRRILFTVDKVLADWIHYLVKRRRLRAFQGFRRSLISKAGRKEYKPPNSLDMLPWIKFVEKRKFHDDQLDSDLFYCLPSAWAED